MKIKFDNAFQGEIEKELKYHIIPFWESLRDDTYGGYYGYMTKELDLDKESVKGCILNSRILWFFSNAYTYLKDEELLRQADHAYDFLKEKCLDKENGGIFWSLTYDGKVEDDIKHTYNQAFCVYALSSYYEASGKEEALKLAYEIFGIIEGKCRDDDGYLEAFSRDFKPESNNDKLSENGVIAHRTMNTLLHVLEAYTEFYRVSSEVKVKNVLIEILEAFIDKLYDDQIDILKVFFDINFNSIIDLESYGHDIEAAWLLNRAVKVIREGKASVDVKEEAVLVKIEDITKKLAKRVYTVAFNGQSLANECDKGVVNNNRIWWVQAESVVGFLDAYEATGNEDYLTASKNQWRFIEEHVVDKRAGSEWFWEVYENGEAIEGRPIVEPWKCPYHNGRMCLEVLKRSEK